MSFCSHDNAHKPVLIGFDIHIYIAGSLETTTFLQVKVYLVIDLDRKLSETIKPSHWIFTPVYKRNIFFFLCS